MRCPFSWKAERSVAQLGVRVRVVAEVFRLRASPGCRRRESTVTRPPRSTPPCPTASSVHEPPRVATLPPASARDQPTLELVLGVAHRARVPVGFDRASFRSRSHGSQRLPSRVARHQNDRRRASRARSSATLRAAPTCTRCSPLPSPAARVPGDVMPAMSWACEPCLDGGRSWPASTRRSKPKRALRQRLDRALTDRSIVPSYEGRYTLVDDLGACADRR
jgi:hypothetical protein